MLSSSPPAFFRGCHSLTTLICDSPLPIPGPPMSSLTHLVPSKRPHLFSNKSPVPQGAAQLHRTILLVPQSQAFVQASRCNTHQILVVYLRQLAAHEAHTTVGGVDQHPGGAPLSQHRDTLCDVPAPQLTPVVGLASSRRDVCEQTLVWRQYCGAGYTRPQTCFVCVCVRREKATGCGKPSWRHYGYECSWSCASPDSSRYTYAARADMIGSGFGCGEVCGDVAQTVT